MKWNGYWKRLCSFALAMVLVLSLMPMPMHAHAAEEETTRTLYMDLSAYEPDSYGEPMVRFYDENNSELNYECSMEGNFDVCVVPVTAKYYKIEMSHAGGGDESGDYPEVPANVDTYIHPTGWSCMHRAGFVDNVCTTCGGEKVATVDDVIYCDFASAVTDWADGGTLTLLKDVTTSMSISLGVEGAEWVLDLNGKTLDLGDVKSLVVTNGELIVQNGTLRAIVIVDGDAGAFAMDRAQLLNSRDGNNALLVNGTHIVDITNSSLIGGVLYTESLVEAYGDVQFDSTYGLYMAGNGAVRFHQTPTAVLPLKVQTPAEGKAYVMAGTDVTLTADQFTSTVTGYKTTVLADGSIGLTVCDHPESEKGYVYLNQDTHKTVCSLCHFESNSTEAAPHTVSNGVCTACGGRQIFVDASYFTSVTNEMLYYYVGGVRTGAAVKKDDAGYYTTVIPAETGKVYWMHGMKNAEYKSEETQLPADKNCMRITGRDSDTGLYTVIWYNHPHEHTYSSETKCCTECLLPCTHSWGGDAVCDSCGYTCTHPGYNSTTGACNTCGKVCEHETYLEGACTTCGMACTEHQLDANGFCTVCDMREIYAVMNTPWTWYDVQVDYHGSWFSRYKTVTPTQVSSRIYRILLPEEAVWVRFFGGDDYGCDTTDELSLPAAGVNCYFIGRTYTIEGSAYYYEGAWGVYPCAHDFSTGTGKCTICGEACAHGDGNWLEGYICGTCGKVCEHETYLEGACNTCGKVCEHETYLQGACAACRMACTEHQLDANGFCTVCDMREIYAVTYYSTRWNNMKAAYQMPGSTLLNYVYADDVEDETENVYRFLLPESATMVRFENATPSIGMRSDNQTLPDADKNCYFIGANTTDASPSTWYFGGIWSVYPCVHDWENSICGLCGKTCKQHKFSGESVETYACTVCGYVCPHDRYNHWFLECFNCNLKCEDFGGHSFDAMGACTVCNVRQFYVDTTKFNLGAGWEELDADIGGALLSATTVEPGIFLITTVDNATYYSFKNGSGAEEAPYTNVYDPIPQNANCLRILTEGIYDEDSGEFAGCLNEWYVYCRHLNHTEEGCPTCGDSTVGIHKEVYTVSADGATVTVSCGIETCGAVLETCTIQVPAHTVYGDGKDPRITFVTGEGNTGFVAEEYAVYYELQNGQWVKLDAAPTNAGTYRAEAPNLGAENDTSDDFTLYVEYTIAKAVPKVTPPVGAGDLAYTGESFALLREVGSTTGGTLQYAVTDTPDDSTEWVATLEDAVWDAGTYTVWYRVLGDENYESVEPACITVKVAEQTLADIVTNVQLAYSSTVYDGTAKEPAVTVTAKLPNAAQVQTLTAGQHYTVQYENNVNAGTAAVTVTGLGNFSGTVTKTFEIQKATIRVSSYSFEGTLTYNGNAQTPHLIYEAATVNGQTLSVTFAIHADDEFGPMPSFTEAGTYSFFCKFSAPNHKDELRNIILRIKQATNTWLVEPAAENWVYGEEPKITMAVPQFGECTVVYSGANSKGINYYSTEQPPTDAGSYEATFSVSPTDSFTALNYTSLETSITFNIGKAPAAVTVAPTANELTYMGDFQQLVTAGASDDGYLVYSLEQDGTYDMIPRVTNAGTYTVWYYVVGDSNHTDSEKQSVTVTVEKAAFEAGNFNRSHPAPKYDGTEKKVNANFWVGDEDPEITVNYYRDGVKLDGPPVDAGTYTYTLDVTGAANYADVYGLADERYCFTVEEAALWVRMQQKEKLIYTGEPQTAELTVTVEVVNDQPVTYTFSTEVDGVYTAEMPSFTEAGWHTVFCKASAPNHTPLAFFFNITIDRAENSWVTAPSIADWVYGEEPSEPTAEAKFGEYTVQYYGTANDGSVWHSETAPTKAGSYTATFTVTETANYSALTATVDFTVEKAICDLSCVEWYYTEAFAYDGLDHTVAVDEATLPEGAFVSTYTGHTASEVGTYQAAATIEYDSNHTGVSTILLDWRIARNWMPTEFVVSAVNEYGWYKQEVVITAADGYQISLTDAIDGEWGYSLTADVEGEDSSITFYLRDEITGAISLAGELVYDLDMTAPTGTAAINGRTATDSLSEHVNFDLFCNKAVEVTLKAADENSGIAAIEYAVSEAVLTVEEVMDIEAWMAYNSTFSVEVKDGKQFVVYVRITDKAGNVTYLCSEGTEYDTAAPVIEGVSDGLTYYTTKNVTISDKNLETVTLNGAESEATFSLEGNREGEYVIVATDKAGNKTVVTVKTAPIAEMADALDGLTEENVTSDDRDMLEEIVAAAEDLLAEENLIDTEQADLETVKEKADALLKTIADAQSAVDTEAINKTLDITEENVKLSDKADLEFAKEDLMQALENHGDNYTEEEKESLEEQVQQIEDALTAIAKIEAVETAIKALPTEVAPDELNQAEKILAVKTTYDALSSYEKSLISEEAKEKLDALVASLTDYSIISGDGSVWTVGSDGTVTIVANGAFSKFIGVEVDGTQITASNYDAKSGSTIVILKTSYLETLVAGEHTMTILFTDGEASAVFKIARATETPPADDSTTTTIPPTEAPTEAPTTPPSVPPTGDSTTTTTPPTEAPTEAPTTPPSVPPTGDSTTTTIPPTEAPTEAPTTPPSVPPTGDSTMLVLWTAMMLISSCAIYILLADWYKRFYKGK